MNASESPLVPAVLGLVGLVLAARIFAEAVDFLLEAASVVFAETVTAPVQEGM